MAKQGFSLSKNLKISEAQQLLILCVLAASIVLGIAISLSLNFLNTISFNAKVIMEKDQAIDAYSSAISTIGVCKKPRGTVYEKAELESCDPSTINIDEIPGTLRYEIINGLAVNPSLNSVSKSTVDNRCINPLTSKNYTIKELNKLYLNAEDVDDRERAGELLKVCSALRTIPDALPAYSNQEAMLSSLNMIFNISGWEPEGLAPDNDHEPEMNDQGIGGYVISMTVDSDIRMAKTLLDNFERSIRNIDITNAMLTWSGDDSVKLEMNANAYFTEKTELTETTKTVVPDSAKGKNK